MDKFKQFLRTITPISDKEYDDTVIYFTEQTFKKGDFFITQGKVCHHVGFIVSGTLRTFYLNDKAQDITSCFCTENNLTTAYKSFISRQASDLSIQAIEDTTLLVIDYDSLQKLYAESPVWQYIGRIVAEHEYIVMEKYASVLNHETTKEKYLRLLREQPAVIQKATVEDIASYLGVSRRTLSRIRQEIAR